MWAWKHTHSITGETEYRELKGALVMDDVDFGYTDDKIVLHNIDLYAEPVRRLRLSVQQVQAKQQSQTLLTDSMIFRTVKSVMTESISTKSKKATFAVHSV